MNGAKALLCLLYVLVLFETIVLSLPKFVWLLSLGFLIMKNQSVASIVWQAISVIVFSNIWVCNFTYFLTLLLILS